MTAPTSIVEKISKLLTQAENPGATQAESEAFMAKAQQLATLNSVDLAKARHLATVKERTTPVVRTITMGDRKTHGLNTYVTLFTGIARANDVRCDIAHNSTSVYAYGFAEDIDVTEALFGSHLLQMVKATEEFRKEGSWKQDVAFQPGYYRYLDANGRDCLKQDAYDELWVEEGYKPMKWRTARLDFQQAYAERVGIRLRQAQRDAEAAAALAETAEERESSGTELVLVEKHEAVAGFYKDKSTARGSYQGGHRGGYSSATHAGDKAGREANLSGKSTPLPGTRKELN